LEKAILVLDGVSDGKTSFTAIVKEAGYWTWNINHKNVLSMLAGKIGWNGIRNNQFYDFIKDFHDLSNKYFDFESWYTFSMIDKFLSSDKANILIVHNCNSEISKKIQEDYENCYNILISDKEFENCEYCKTLDFSSNDFKPSVLESIKIITNNKEIKNING
jgi:hypothetical protein